jgi:hypothetical protein
MIGNDTYTGMITVVYSNGTGEMWGEGEPMLGVPGAGTWTNSGAIGLELHDVEVADSVHV